MTVETGASSFLLLQNCLNVTEDLNHGIQLIKISFKVSGTLQGDLKGAPLRCSLGGARACLEAALRENTLLRREFEPLRVEAAQRAEGGWPAAAGRVAAGQRL